MLDYILQTTHPDHPDQRSNRSEWVQNLKKFSEETLFEGLSIHDFYERGGYGEVTFTAELTQGGKNISFTEKSAFLKRNGKWLYRSGKQISHPSI